MARARKLKVYRTPIGFYDAYVAAPSQKAALTAWGSNVDLFARGVAEVVKDEALTREPLADPGKIVRRSRGSADEHLAALPPNSPRRTPVAQSIPDDADTASSAGDASRARKTTKPSNRRRASRPANAARASASANAAKTEAKPPPKLKAERKPKPSRKRLERAERELDELVARQRAEAATLREEEQAASKRRREADRRHERERAKAEAAAAAARRAYGEALARS